MLPPALASNYQVGTADPVGDGYRQHRNPSLEVVEHDVEAQNSHVLGLGLDRERGIEAVRQHGRDGGRPDVGPHVDEGSLNNCLRAEESTDLRHGAVEHRELPPRPLSE